MTEAFLLLWSLPGSGLSNLDYDSEHGSCCKGKGQGVHTEAGWNWQLDKFSAVTARAPCFFTCGQTAASAVLHFHVQLSPAAYAFTINGQAFEPHGNALVKSGTAAENSEAGIRPVRPVHIFSTSSLSLVR